METPQSRTQGNGLTRKERERERYEDTERQTKRQTDTDRQTDRHPRERPAEPAKAPTMQTAGRWVCSSGPARPLPPSTRLPIRGEESLSGCGLASYRSACRCRREQAGLGSGLNTGIIIYAPDGIPTRLWGPAQRPLTPVGGQAGAHWGPTSAPSLRKRGGGSGRIMSAGLPRAAVSASLIT